MEDCHAGYVTFMLTGHVQSWWMGQSNLLEECGHIITWIFFKEYYLGKYFLRQTRKEKEREFDALKQRNMSLGEYIWKFESLIKYSEFYKIRPHEDWKCHKFRDGLRYEILKVSAPLHLEQFVELVERCREVESVDSLKNQSIGGLAREDV